jgi:hypothetical protein
MTKAEIKKALECCIAGKCWNCPYVNIIGCQIELRGHTFDLIAEQEKDIMQLKAECALLDDELRIARQNTIDVLNKLKEKSYVNDYCREVVEVEKIDELIKELAKK